MKSADSLIRALLPKEERFHELVARDSENLVKGGRLFAEIARSESLEDRRVKAVQLKAIEHEGDLITRSIFDALNTSFITPFDREDIRSIAIELDDVLDFLEGAVQYLVLFEIGESPEALRHFADILVKMIDSIERMSRLLWDMGNEAAIRESLMRVSELENEADQLYNTVIADLFKSGRNPVEIMKWKEVYQALEEACDTCRNFANTVANVLVKNA